MWILPVSIFFFTLGLIAGTLVTEDVTLQQFEVATTKCEPNSGLAHITVSSGSSKREIRCKNGASFILTHP